MQIKEKSQQAECSQLHERGVWKIGVSVQGSYNQKKIFLMIFSIHQELKLHCSFIGEICDAPGRSNFQKMGSQIFDPLQLSAQSQKATEFTIVSCKYKTFVILLGFIEP